MPESHLMVIRGSIFVSHDSPEAHHAELLRLAQDVFDELNEDLHMRPILKLVGRAGGFKIIFDFKRDHVQFMDPLSDQYTKGLYTTRHIYIGARGLLSSNDEKRQDVKATASHEVNHFAMDLTYDNSCKPYAKDALITTKLRYRQVLKHCREQKHQEQIIDWVFSNKSVQIQFAELIVRVPHMRTRYAHDQQRLSELGSIFRPLFEFYDQQVLKDVEAAIPNILTTIGERRKRFKDARPKQMVKSKVTIAIFIAIFILLGSSAIFLKLFSGQPSGQPSDQPECFIDSQCSNEMACIDKTCTDKCLVQTCSVNKTCVMENRQPVCMCPPNGHCDEDKSELFSEWFSSSYDH
jgi:hypothetical protein